MELTGRQKLTIEHLKGIGIEQPLDIIKFCIEKLAKPNCGLMRLRAKKFNLPKVKRSGCRMHSKTYYQGIINYLAQQTKLPSRENTTNGEQ